MFSFSTLRRPRTASFHTAVRTVLPFHSMSRGRPTFTESSCAIEILIGRLTSRRAVGSVSGGNRRRQRADLLGPYALLKPHCARADEGIEPGGGGNYDMNLVIDYNSKPW